jgi:membrane fusion protein (multidrug efflux system)
VPVRIAIDPEELKKTPLRPGLSTVTSINVSAEPKTMNESIVKTAAGEYATEVFDKDLEEARARAQKIVRENLVGGANAGDGACAAAAD